MSFEYFEEIYVSRYSADIHTYDARQLEPYHVLPFSPRPPVRPTADHDFGRRRHDDGGGGGGGGGAKGVFVCRRICHDDASGGRTDAAAVAAVAKNNGVGACDSDSGDGTRLKRQVNSFDSGDAGGCCCTGPIPLAEKS